MNLHQLYIFHKVAQLEHFSRAAEELFISQPAVSKGVQELEKALGQPLFDHIGRNVQLNQAGRLLYDYANQIFALENEAETALQQLDGLERGRLAISATMTIGTYLLPEPLGRFRTLYPAIELSLDIANAAEVQAKVLANLFEVGLVEGFVTAPELVSSVWRQDEMVLIDATRQPLIAEEVLSLSQLLERRIPFILREPGSGTRAVLDKAIASRQLPPIKPALQLNSLEAIKRTVSAGLGVSFVSNHSVKLEIELGLIRRVRLTDFELIRSLHLVSAPGKKLSKATQAFLKLI